MERLTDVVLLTIVRGQRVRFRPLLTPADFRALGADGLPPGWWATALPAPIDTGDSVADHEAWLALPQIQEIAEWRPVLNADRRYLSALPYLAQWRNGEPSTLDEDAVFIAVESGDIYTTISFYPF